MNITKKIVATIVGFSMVLMMAPGVARGATVEELQAQVSALLAQISALQSQIAALTGAPAGAPAACSGITFTVNLAQGSSGAAVKCLQALLNRSADTQIAASGVGSAGNETTYFGPLTRAAVVKFQAKYAAEVLTPFGLTAGTGFVGSATRAKLNALLVAAPPVTPPADREEPVTTPGKEGTLTVTAAVTPANAQTIYAGNTKVGIAGLDVKASGSDIKLNRLDINFTSRPWLNISNITISDGTTDVLTYAVTQANTIEVTAGSSYTVRITGLNITVPDGTTKTLTIKVDPKLVAGTTSSGMITYTILANALRGTDGIGLTQYAPSGSLDPRNFTVSSSIGALALSVNAGNPVERAVIGSATAITQNVELLRFDLKATVNDVIVSNASTTLTNPAAIQTLKLYDGDTILASAAAAATVAFTPLNLRIAKDTTKTLSIKADVNEIDGSPVVEGASSSVSVTTANITAADAGTYQTLTSIGGANALGKTAHFYTAAPSLKLVSHSIATNRDGRATASSTISADAKIKFEVTALGGDIYVGSTTAGANLGIIATTSPFATNISMNNSYASNATIEGPAWLVRQGETKWFEVTSFITNDTGNNATSGRFVYMHLNSVRWGTTTAAVATYNWNWTDIQNDFRTTSVFLSDDK